jgi:hypothetical protein
MSKKKKVIDSKVIVTIVLLAVLIVAAVALVYAVEIAPSNSRKSGLQVGDTFFYNITGTSKLFSSNAATPAYLSAYNGTDYYEVNITGVSGSLITFNTVWQFKNGTTIQNPEYVNLVTGANSGDFWAIYLPNLNKNNLLNPKGDNGLIVNSTSTETFADSTRTINTWSTDNILYDSSDPTGSSQQDNYIGVDFDRQTGMLVDLTNLEQFNNPQYDILITWTLTNSTVWTV